MTTTSIPPKPIALQPIPENIPDELKANTRFVMWSWEYRNGKQHTPGRWTKPPYTTAGTAAAVDNPDTWTDFESALAAYRGGEGFDGFGCVLQAGDGYTGIDLDHCIDPDGTIAPWALAIIQRFASYTEVSPSGAGIRIFLRGSLPPGRRRKGPIEMYSEGRYLTLTGRRVDDAPATIEERTIELAAFHRETFGEPKPVREATSGTTPALTLEDDELLLKARAAKNGDAFSALYDRGDTGRYATADNDGTSEADAALCAYLWFWTSGDAAQIDRLFRRSALYRDKWERADYREWTLTLVRDGTIYAPGPEVIFPSPEPTHPAQGETDDPHAELARLREVAAVQAARIAQLEAERAADAQVRAVNREIRRVVTSEAHPAKKVSMILVALEVHSNRTENLLSLEGMAKVYHVGEDSLRAARDAYAERGAIEVKPVYYSCSPYTGEVHSPPLPYSRVVPTSASPAETIAALVDDLPESWKPPAEKPPKREKVQPEAPDETPICPVDGEAETRTAERKVAVTSCAPCGLPLAAVVDGVVLTLPPEPTHPAQGDPSPPAWLLVF